MEQVIKAACGTISVFSYPINFRTTRSGKPCWRGGMVFLITDKNRNAARNLEQLMESINTLLHNYAYNHNCNHSDNQHLCHTCLGTRRDKNQYSSENNLAELVEHQELRRNTRIPGPVRWKYFQMRVLSCASILEQRVLANARRPDRVLLTCKASFFFFFISHQTKKKGALPFCR